MKPTKAHELLSGESRWLKNAAAKDAVGNKVNPLSQSAVSFCALGALENTGGIGNRSITKLRAVVCNQLGFKSIAEWNDLPGRTFQEVKDLLVKLDI